MNVNTEAAREARRKYRASGTQLTASVKLGAADNLDELVLCATELAAQGHRRFLLALDDCTDSRGENAVKALLSIKRAKAAIRRIDVCIAGTVEPQSLRILAEAGASVLIFPAASEASLIAKEAGISDLGLGMRFDADFEAELEVLSSRAKQLSPRELVIRRAPELDAATFARLAAAVRYANPLCGLTVDATEAADLLDFATTIQTNDADESLDSLVNRLLRAGRLPGFCTGCAEEKRCGAAHRELCEKGSLHNYCYLNTLLSLKEYLTDFGSQDTRIIGVDRVLKELYTIRDDAVRGLVVKAMKDMRNGERGLHF